MGLIRYGSPRSAWLTPRQSSAVVELIAKAVRGNLLMKPGRVKLSLDDVRLLDASPPDQDYLNALARAADSLPRTGRT